MENTKYSYVLFAYKYEGSLLLNCYKRTKKGNRNSTNRLSYETKQIKTLSPLSKNVHLFHFLLCLCSVFQRQSSIPSLCVCVFFFCISLVRFDKFQVHVIIYRCLLFILKYWDKERGYEISYAKVYSLWSI